MEEEKRFKPGDIVELVSGGPPMTIKNVVTTNDVLKGHYHVIWFEEESYHQNAILSPALLKPHDPVAYHRRREQALFLASARERPQELKRKGS